MIFQSLPGRVMTLTMILTLTGEWVTDFALVVNSPPVRQGIISGVCTNEVRGGAVDVVEEQSRSVEEKW